MSVSTNETSTDSSETCLYLVRHGETEYNRRGIVQGREIDSVLNEKGYSQAEALADRLADRSFDAIYSSPLRRTRQTTAVLAAHHPETPVRYLEDLEEISWGAFEGEPPSPERNQQLDAIKKRWREGAADEPIEGGESALDVQERALRAVRHITNEQPGGTSLVVTHGRYLRILLASLLDAYGLERMHELPHSNTAVNRLVPRDDSFEADLLNCTAHLK